MSDSEKQFQKIIQNTTAVILRVNLHGEIIFANKHALDLFGYSEEELLGKHAVGVIIPEQESSGRDLVKMVENITKGPDNFYQNINENISKKGERIWIEWTNSGIYDDEDKLKEILTVGIDITGRMKAEKALRDSERNYNELFGVLSAINFNYNVVELIRDQNGKAFDFVYREVNSVSEKLLGKSREELIGKTRNEIFGEPREKEDIIIEQYSEIDKTGKAIHFESYGSALDKYYDIYAWKHTKGQIASIASDITGQKKAEKALKESELKYRTLILTIPDAILVHSEGLIKFANPAALKLFRVNESELIGMSLFDLFPKDRHDIIKKRVKQAAKEQTPLLEYEIIRPDGSKFDGEITGKNILFNNEIATQIIIRDVTERKEAEDELKSKQAEFETLFDNTPAGMVLFDAKPPYTVLVHNKYYQEFFAEPYRSQGMLGLSIYEYAPKVEAEGVVDVFKEVIRTKESIEYIDFPYKSNYPNQSWFDWYMLPVIVDGDVISLVSMSVDVTSRHNMEEALRESNERFKLAQNVSNVGVFEWNIQTGINTWTPELEAMYGLLEGAFPGTQEAWEKLLHPDDKNETIRRVRIALETGEPVEAEFRIVWPDKSTRWLLGRWQAIIDEDGNFLKLIGVNVDITERKKIEEKLQKLLENEKELRKDLQLSNEELIQIQNELNDNINKLEISNKELEQFAYVASHDLQEPLRMVGSFSQLLEKRYKDKLGADADDYIKFIVEGAQRMKNLIDDLLVFSRLNTEKKEFNFTDLNQLLNNLLINLKSSIEEVDAQITHDILPIACCDSSQIYQVFQNLISNSIKFHQTPPRIHISSEESDGEWILGVSDKGIGIDPNHHQKIFDVFKRLHTREEYAGSGIGLSICKRIVERHNGTIWVESEPGKGANFYFTIPKLELLK